MSTICTKNSQTKIDIEISHIQSKTYLRNFLNLHKTHATVPSDWQALVVAEARNLHSYLLTCLWQDWVTVSNLILGIKPYVTACTSLLCYLQHSGPWLHHDRIPIHEHLQEVRGGCCCCSCGANFKHRQKRFSADLIFFFALNKIK